MTKNSKPSSLESICGAKDVNNHKNSGGGGMTTAKNDHKENSYYDTSTSFDRAAGHIPVNICDIENEDDYVTEI